MIRLLCLFSLTVALLSCATPTQHSPAKSEPKTGVVKVRVEFGKDGQVIEAQIIEKTGVMAQLSPEDDKAILDRVRSWEIPGQTGTRILPIRFGLK